MFRTGRLCACTSRTTTSFGSTATRFCYIAKIVPVIPSMPLKTFLLGAAGIQEENTVAVHGVLVSVCWDIQHQDFATRVLVAILRLALLECEEENNPIKKKTPIKNDDSIKQDDDDDDVFEEYRGDPETYEYIGASFVELCAAKSGDENGAFFLPPDKMGALCSGLPDLNYTALKLVQCTLDSAQQTALVHLAPCVALKQCRLGPEADGKGVVDLVKDGQDGLMKKLILESTWPFDEPQTLSLLDSIQEWTFDIHLEREAFEAMLSHDSVLKQMGIAGAYCILKGDNVPFKNLIIRSQQWSESDIKHLVGLLAIIYKKAVLNEGHLEEFVKTRADLFSHINGLSQTTSEFEFPLTVVMDKGKLIHLGKRVKCLLKSDLLKLAPEGSELKNCIFDENARNTTRDEMESFIESNPMARDSKSNLSAEQKKVVPLDWSLRDPRSTTRVRCPECACPWDGLKCESCAHEASASSESTQPTFLGQPIGKANVLGGGFAFGLTEESHSSTIFGQPIGNANCFRGPFTFTFGSMEESEVQSDENKSNEAESAKDKQPPEAAGVARSPKPDGDKQAPEVSGVSSSPAAFVGRRTTRGSSSILKAPPNSSSNGTRGHSQTKGNEPVPTRRLTRSASRKQVGQP